MLKQYLFLPIIFLSIVGCNSSSVTTEDHVETNSVSSGELELDSSLSNSLETESVTVEVLDVQQCNLTSEISEVAINTINQIRAQGRNCGSVYYDAVDPIVWNSFLATSAQLHSDDMASLDFFSHTGSNGSTLGERISNVGYVWQSVGENISAGRSSLQDTINGWLDSPGHCANIMNSSFAEMAIACTENSTSTYGVYWTQVFATQR